MGWCFTTRSISRSADESPPLSPPFPALLVILSRRDSVPTTWAATLLTAALVIAAMVQKQTQSITLHHAILTLK